VVNGGLTGENISPMLKPPYQFYFYPMFVILARRDIGIVARVCITDCRDDIVPTDFIVGYTQITAPDIIPAAFFHKSVVHYKP